MDSDNAARTTGTTEVRTRGISGGTAVRFIRWFYVVEKIK